jgi:hypothetical protein
MGGRAEKGITLPALISLLSSRCTAQLMVFRQVHGWQMSNKTLLFKVQQMLSNEFVEVMMKSSGS